MVVGNMNSLKKTKLNVLVSVAYQIIAIALGLIIPRITLVGYGSSVNGLLSSVLQIVGYLALFEAGIQAVATKSMYKTVAQCDQEGTNAILAAVNKNYKKIGVYYFVGLLAIAFIYPLFVKVDGLSYFAIFCVVVFSGLSNVILFFFQGKYRILLQVEGKNYFISLLNIITNICNHGIKIILLYFQVNIAIVVFGSFFASMISAVVIMVYIKKNYKWIDLKTEPNFDSLKQSKDAIVHQVSWMVFSSTDTLILTIFCGLKVVSVYVIYKMINDYMLAFSKIPFEGMSFRLGQLYNTNKEKFKGYIDAVELFTGNICFILFTVTLCLTTSFVRLYTGGVQDINYVDSKLAVLFVAVQLLSYARTPMLNTISYAGHFRQTLLPTIIETLINIVVSIWGVRQWGIYGVLAGTVASLLYRTVDVIIYSNKKLLNRSPLRTFSYYVVETVLLICIYTIFISLNVSIDNYSKFVLSGGILLGITGMIFVGVSCIVFKREFVFLRENILRGRKK